jgi:hypothetical protein
MALDIQAVFFPHLSGGRIEPQENWVNYFRWHLV